MRKMLTLLAVLTLVVGIAPGQARIAPPKPNLNLESPIGALTPNQEETNPALGFAVNRLNAWTPKPAGTFETIVLQYGPYLVHPGADLPRADVEIAVGQTGYIVTAEPVVRRIDGTVPSLLDIHIHHAHWFWPDTNESSYYRWIYGTGEEQTQGSIDLRAQQDPRYVSEGLRYGIKLTQGEQVAFLSMLHNKTTQPQLVWLEARLGFVYGSAEEIAAGARTPQTPFGGSHFRHILPTLHGSTFNVPRTGGIFAWPRDATPEMLQGYGASMQRGVGHKWTSPISGTIVVGAGHMHPGGDNVVVSNLGSQASPCGGTWLSDPDGDGFPGVALVRSRHLTRHGIRPSEDFQMGITNPGWRATIRQGDVLAINGVYDATNHAYPDAMSFFGFYTDTTAGEQMTAPCTSRIITDPQADPTLTDINRPWSSREPLPVCTVCDANTAAPEAGPAVNVITIAGFSYLLGNGGSGIAPAIPRGTDIQILNLDAALGIRHTLTTCPAPCDGAYRANYPFPDGRIESGVIGIDYQSFETYVSVTGTPNWTLPTSSLNEGLYTFFCRLHPTMRGSFFVTE